MEQQSHHTIIKNATALTLRMVFTTLIGVYTFRIVLDALGIDNYGIYTLVFGIIGTVTFLNTSMAGATSRFLSYALGQDNGQKTGKIFSAALICHTCIASIVFIISETVGLWFLNSKLNIPDESMAAANVVYQLSVVSMVVGFTQVPYTAVILSYEKMTIYAYIEILNALLKLFIAFFILTLSAERLVIYASLLTGTSVIVMFIYRLYCVRQFVTARFHRPVDLKICKKML